jgi:pyroglutamyl-peptidase
MMNRPPRLLVTGFGPFPGIPKNPSAEAARRVAHSLRLRRLGIDARCVVLLTTYAALKDELLPALEEHRPDALLMIGVAGRAREVRVETRGVNRVSILSPDAAKARPSGLTLTAGERMRRTAISPIQSLTTLRRHGFKARLSIDAGRYLCNASYFTALNAPMPVLFVHIPKPGRGIVKRAGVKRRQTWQGRLAQALTEVAGTLVRATRQSLLPLAREC